MKYIRTYLLMIFVPFSAIICNAQTEIYKLRSKTANADFNYPILDHFDSNVDPNEQSFDPVEGKYTVYKFVYILETKFYDDHNKWGKDINYDAFLIVKTDHHNKIIDAYQYTLDFVEPPFCLGLFKYTAKNIFLTNRLSINSLKLTSVCLNEKGKRKLFKEKGIISLKTK